MAGTVYYGLELDGRTLKLSCSERGNGKSAVPSVLIRTMAGKGESEVSGILRALVREKGIEGKRLSVIFPRADVLVKYVDLPSVDDSEIEQMLRLQAVKESPFPPEDIYVSSGVIEKDVPGNRASAVIAIVRKEVMDAHLDILKRAGITPRCLVLGSYALAGFISRYRDDRGGGLLAIDAGPSSLELVFMRGDGAVFFSRNIPLAGGKDVAGCMNEIRQSLQYYQYRRMGPPVETFALTGATPVLAGWEEELRGNFKLPVERITVSEEIVHLEEDVRPGGHSSLAAIAGVAGSRPEDIGFNLLPEEIRVHRRAAVVKRASLAACILLVSILLVGAGRQVHRVEVKQAYLRELEQSLKDTSLTAAGIRNARLKIKMVQDETQKAERALEVFSDCYIAIPGNVFVSLYQYDENTGVSIQGSAFTMPEVFALVAALQKMKRFGHVGLKYANKRKIEDREMIDFQVDCLLLSDAEGERNEAV